MTTAEDYPSSQIDLIGTTLNYVQTGQGPTLVFIHGLANNWEGWIPVIPYLENNFTCCFLDLPGFGDSDSLEKYSVEIAAKYVAKFIDESNLKPRAVIGASMGSIVTGELVKQNPKISQSAILIGPVIKHGNGQRAAKAMEYSMRAIKKFELSQRALKKVLETRLAAYTIAKTINMHKFNRFIIDSYNLIGKKKMRKEAFTQMAISSAEYDLNKVVEQIALPTLLLYGREDKVSSPNFARQHLAPNNQHLTIIDIPEAGHVVPMEKPRETARAIKEFLDTI